MKDETGSQGALRLLKMASEQPTNAPSIVDAIRDASAVESSYNEEFLNTIAAFAIEGWRRA